MGVLEASSFSVLRGTPIAFFCYYFKKLNCYNFSFLDGSHDRRRHLSISESWEPGSMGDIGSTLYHGKFPRSFDLPEVGPLADALEGEFCVNHSCSR
jgi:hypothetical protein